MSSSIDSKYVNTPLYQELRVMSNERLDDYEESLRPKDFLDKIRFYFDGRSKKVKTIEAVFYHRGL